MTLQYFLRLGVSPMMRVVEQSDKTELVFQRSYGVDQFRRIPFMNYHDIDVSQFGGSVSSELFVKCVEPHVEVGELRFELLQGPIADAPSLSLQIRTGPRVHLFITADTVAKVHQFVHEAAQKMRISVVPVRS